MYVKYLYFILRENNLYNKFINYLEKEKDTVS